MIFSLVNRIPAFAPGPRAEKGGWTRSRIRAVVPHQYGRHGGLICRFGRIVGGCLRRREKNVGTERDQREEEDDRIF